MTRDQLLFRSQLLKDTADEIVSRLHLIDIANKYSECHQIGSSVMNLMVDEDIDFICYCQNAVDIDDCLSFAKDLLKHPEIQILRIKNYLDIPQYSQFKVYVDPYKYKNSEWQIAFSFEVKTDQTVKNELDIIPWVTSKITPITKKKILQLKQSCRQQGIKVPSFYIYHGVLEHNFDTLDSTINFYHLSGSK